MLIRLPRDASREGVVPFFRPYPLSRQFRRADVGRGHCLNAAVPEQTLTLLLSVDLPGEVVPVSGGKAKIRLRLVLRGIDNRDAPLADDLSNASFEVQQRVLIDVDAKRTGMGG